MEPLFPQQCKRIRPRKKLPLLFLWKQQYVGYYSTKNDNDNDCMNDEDDHDCDHDDSNNKMHYSLEISLYYIDDDVRSLWFQNTKNEKNKNNDYNNDSNNEH